MNIIECSKQLRELSKAHAHYTMSLDEYRHARKVLFDALDLNVNGIATHEIEAIPTTDLDITQHIESHEQLDKTQPYFAGKIDKCMSFIKGSNNN